MRIIQCFQTAKSNPFACLAYKTMVHTSKGQTPFCTTFGLEATLPEHWVNLHPSNNFAENLWKFPGIFPGNQQKFPEIFLRKFQ